MAISDDFKEQLKAGRIVDALTLALGEAVELEITTWVSSSKNPETNTQAETAKPAPDSRMRTRLNIVEGAIDNEVGSRFIGNGPYTELREFHMEQVQQGRQIIQHNLENLQQLFTVLTHTLTHLPPASRRLADGTSVLPPSEPDNKQ